MPGGVNVGDFTSANDIVIFKGNFSAFAPFDGIASAGSGNLEFGNGWDADDPLAFVWFPTAGSNATSVSAGESYGLYTNPVAQDSSEPWITPANNTTDYVLQLFTDDGSFIVGNGTVDSGSVAASLQVIPEPSISLLAFLSGLLLFRRRR